jgi:hypothetical protein
LTRAPRPLAWVSSSGIAPALRGGAMSLCLLAACRAETRGWVLSERDATAEVAPADAGCATCIDVVALDGGSLTPLHGSQGGSEHVDVCPGNQLVIGYQGSVGDVSASAEPLVVTQSLQAVCGTPRAAADGAIAIARAGMLPLRGAIGALASWSQLCPPDAAIVGVEGRAGLALDQIAFVCAQLTASAGEDGGLTLESTTVLTPAGGEGGRAFADACPSGEVARGHRLRAGRWIDAFSLVCSALRVDPEP